jgi:hypothetical protein
MNWFEQNRWLGVFLIVFALAVIGSAYFLFSAKSNSTEASARFQEAISEKNRLERLDPFPSEANFRKMKLHLENYEATLAKAKEELKARVPAAPALAPNEFQSRLRQAMIGVAERARTNRVRLPDNFALGFEEYTTALPNTTAAPLLGQELSQVEVLMNVLIDARVDRVTLFARKPLPEERTAAATPTPGPQGKPAPAGMAGPKLVERGVVDVTFGSAPSAARKVLNQIVSSPQQFYVVRLLHIRNEKDKGPPREQAAAGGPTGAVAGPSLPTQPTAARPLSAAALNFIVGNEHIETSARIELIRFAF